MKLKYKIMLNMNVNNLNKIPIQDLSWECIDYALKKGFFYQNAIDDRYEKYIDYVVYNLKNHRNYLYKLIDKHSDTLKNSQVQEIILNIINNDAAIVVDEIIELIKITGGISFITKITRINEVSDYDKQKLYDVILDYFDYENLPESIIKNNVVIGKMYLNKNINNIKTFLKYNDGNYDIDEIANLINDNCKSDAMFEILFNYLKTQTVSEAVWKKIIKNNCNNIERISLLFNNFDEPKLYSSIIVPTIIDNHLINSIDEKNVKIIYDNRCYEQIKDYVIQNNLVEQLVSAISKSNIDVPINDYSLTDMCIKSHYLLSKDSPEWLKSNITLAISSLKQGTISINDLNTNNFINNPVEDLMELVNVGVLKKDDERILEDLRSIISLKVKDELRRSDDKIYYLVLDKIPNEDYYDYIASNIPDDVHDLYLTSDNTPSFDKKRSNIHNSIKNFDIDKINKLIVAIKKQNKNVKLNFAIEYEKESDEISSELLSQLIDTNMVIFNSINKNNRINATEMLNLNQTLDLFAKDINNSNLSPYEKYIAVYNIVKSFKKYKRYKNSEREDSKNYDQSRSIYLIMQNDYMVCVGYASMLEALLKRVGVDSVSYAWYEGEHQLNYVKIVDDKYGINGIFKADPTNDNDILDPINNSYRNVNLNIEEELENTLLDRFLNSNDNYVDELESRDLDLLYNYAIELYSELKQETDKKKALLIFKQKYKNQVDKDIDKSKTIDAIISVKEHIAGRTFDSDEKRREKNWLIIENFIEKRKLIDYGNDLLLFKNELFNMKFGEYSKISHSYKKMCFDNIMKQLVEEYNKINGDGVVIGINYKSEISMLYQNLTLEQQQYLEEYFNSNGITTVRKSKDNNLFLVVKLNSILQDEIIGGDLFNKISEIQESVILSQSKII